MLSQSNPLHPMPLRGLHLLTEQQLTYVRAVRTNITAIRHALHDVEKALQSMIDEGLEDNAEVVHLAVHVEAEAAALIEVAGLVIEPGTDITINGAPATLNDLAEIASEKLGEPWTCPNGATNRAKDMVCWDKSQCGCGARRPEADQSV